MIAFENKTSILKDYKQIFSDFYPFMFAFGNIRDVQDEMSGMFGEWCVVSTFGGQNLTNIRII